MTGPAAETAGMVAWPFRLLLGLMGLLPGGVLRGQEEVWVRIGMAEGLSQSTVSSLLEDRWGFIWVGTMDGAVRFGAEGADRILPGKGFRGREVRRIVETRDGTVWICHINGPLLSVRDGQARTWTRLEGLPEDGVFGLAEDGAGGLFALASAGLFRREGDRWRVVPLPGLWEGASLWSLAWIEGRLWIGDRGGRLASWDGQRLREVPRTWVGGISDLVRGADGSGWLMTRQCVLRYQAGGWEPTALRRERLLGTMPGFGPHGAPLVSDFAGRIWTLDGAGALLEAARLPGVTGTTSLVDRTGRLWVGTLAKGLVVRRPGRLMRMELPEGEGGGLGAWALLWDRGRLLVGTERGLLSWEEGRGVRGLGSGTAPFHVYALARDGRGGVWLGTQNGLQVLRGDRVESKPVEGVGQVSSLTAWDGGLALGTHHGVVLVDAKGRFRRRVLAAGGGLSYVQAVIAYQGRLYAAFGSGLMVLDGEGMVPAFPDAPFGRSQVQTLWEDPKGRLWVAGDKGLYRQGASGWEEVDPGWEEQQTQVSALASLGGEVVVGHGRGVSILGTRGLVRLGRNQGLLGEEVAGGALLVDPQGRLWVGCTEGLYRIDAPGELRPDVLLPPVLMPAQGLDLPSAEGRDLQFQLRVPMPLPPYVPRTAFVLDGVEIQKRGQASGQELVLGRLGPGTYRLSAKARMDGGAWVEGAPLQLRIRPAWHEHPATRTGFGGLLGLGAIVGLRWRSRSLRRRNAVLAAEVARQTQSLSRRNADLEEAHGQVKEALEARMRQTRSVVHDLRGPLAAISLVAQRLDGRVASGDGRLVDILQSESGRLDRLLRNLLDEARLQQFLPGLQMRPIRPYEVFEGLLEGLRERAEAKGLAFRFEEEPEGPGVVVEGDPLALQQVLLNLAGNALKFTEAGAVGIHSRREDGHWVLEVRDTGRGMSMEEASRLFAPFSQLKVEDADQGWGLGLSIVQGIVEQHRGRIEVDSHPGLGSVFRVWIPASEPSREA